MSGFPAHPVFPAREEAAAAGTDAIRLFGQRVRAWKAEVAVWLAAHPGRVVWRYQEGGVKVLGPNIPAHPGDADTARVTAFVKAGDGHSWIPCGHGCYADRQAAMECELPWVEALLEHIPGPVLTEEEIQTQRNQRVTADRK